MDTMKQVETLAQLVVNIEILELIKDGMLVGLIVEQGLLVLIEL